MKKLNTNELSALIENNTAESTHVDFKEKWHDNNATLIHDILCMCNADISTDRFILFGINDNAIITGVNTEDNNCKDSAKLYNSLRDSNFNRLPELDVYRLIIEEKSIDLIHIAKSSHKPFFLNRDKQAGNKIVRAGVVYTRNGSANTPRNSSASEVEIEKMWRERFGLLLTPLERFFMYIEDIQNWAKSESDPSSATVFYYKLFPEFTLKGIFETPRKDFFEHWNNSNRSNENPTGYKLGCINVQLTFHSTVLTTHELINVEWGSLYFATPTYIDAKNVYTNPHAKIDTEALAHKIAAIFSESESIENYDDYLLRKLPIYNLDVALK